MAEKVIGHFRGMLTFREVGVFEVESVKKVRWLTRMFAGQLFKLFKRIARSEAFP